MKPKLDPFEVFIFNLCYQQNAQMWTGVNHFFCFSTR